jgi:hypothetical protein
MFPPRRSLLPFVLVCLVLPGAAGCGREAISETGSEGRFYTADDLPDLVLHRDEAPEGTEFLKDRSGRRDLERFWPSSCCVGVQVQFEEAGFQTAHVALFERPGHSADPVDTRPGWELVTSSAVLFMTDEGAAEAMDMWIDHHRAPVLDPVDVRGLGKHAVGLAGSPTSPAEQQYLYFWRRGRLLLALRASTGAGTVSVEQVHRLVDRMDARAS